MSVEPEADGGYDVVVIGGGAAGVGVGVALRHAGIDNFVILERFMVGASFLLWTEETRFITPSFPTNSIGMLDLNAVALGTSPAYILEMEHPTGAAYAVYLRGVAEYHELPIRERTSCSGSSRASGGAAAMSAVAGALPAGASASARLHPSRR